MALKSSGLDDLKRVEKHPSGSNSPPTISGPLKAHAGPDGFEIQVIAMNREAVILCKWALECVTLEDLLVPDDPAERG
jgi:hypothetical protein